MFNISPRQNVQVRSLALVLALIAGSTASLSARGDDGGAAGVIKPAAKQPDAAQGAPKEAAKPAPKADAATPNAKEQAAKDEEMLKDFSHYVHIDRPDLAKAMAQGLLDRQFSPQEFTKLVDRVIGFARFQDSIGKAQRFSGLDDVAAQLLKTYEGGQTAEARDPARITANIKLLNGDGRQYYVGRARLLEAGGYAVPQLFTAYFSTQDVVLASRIRGVLVEMGPHSVMPLVTALPKLTPAQQEQVCMILGERPHTQALPFLYDLASTSQSPSVKTAALAAIHGISGAVNEQMPIAERYNDLADGYFAASPSLMTFPKDANQPVWDYQPGAGLTFHGVDTRVYGQTMAMKVSELALKKDANSIRGISTWIAANFSREIRTPEGYEHPVYGKDRPEAMFYGVAAGPRIGQNVLGKALDMGDTPLVRRALSALQKTAGRDLWKAYQDPTIRKPLLEALRYPNRRVQYETADAIGTAQPKDPFEGSQTVVRILGSAIRDASTKFALVVAKGSEEQAPMVDLLKKNGFTVLPPATNVNDVRQSIADSPGVDVIMTDLPSQQTGDLIAQVQSDARLRATPILSIVTSQARQELFPRYSRDVRVRLVGDGAGPADVEASMNDLILAATGGPITAAEAEAYKSRALTVLRDIAIARNPNLDIQEAQGPLVTAVADATGDTRVRIAEVLSLIDSKPAQVALFDAALGSESADKTRLLAYCADSAKRFGNLADKRQVDSLVKLTTQARGEEATAAAAVVGALNLPTAGVVPLIMGTPATGVSNAK